MTRIRELVGRWGVWHSSRTVTPELVAGIEQAGYGAFWSGSDRLVDAVIAHGPAGPVAARLAEHLDAGADHVAVQAIGPDPLADLRTLAPLLAVSAPAGG